MANNENRLTKVRYRAPGAEDWVEMTWEEAIPMIARHVKDTRDADFQLTNAAGNTVNRTMAIGSFGSAALDNEECWLYQRMLRALGLVYIEHQARN
jgi:formate dehydrogenase major subunit